MKNKGFTLIELLGGIVILSIIALITIPVITGVINKTRLQSLKNSAYGMLDATNLYYAQVEPTKNLRFDIENNTMTSSDTTKMISYKGTIKAGSVILNKNGKTTICITDGKNSAYKNYNESEIKLVEKQTCYIPDNKSIVYLENSGATRTELSAQELTDKVAELEEEINTLKEENTTIKNTKADKTEVEAVGTIANSSTLDKVYPVGSIYITTTEDTVAKVQTRFGGAWVKLENSFLYATSGESNQKGGQSSVTYTPVGIVNGTRLTFENLPGLTLYGYSQNGSRSMNYYNSSFVQSGKPSGWTVATVGDHGLSYGQEHSHTFTGTQVSISTMPPYITVYMYKRTA